jgi:putative phage-type endonuclease
MTTVATAVRTGKPWISGHCNPSCPPDSHGRCRKGRWIPSPSGRKWLACSCSCHLVEAEIVEDPAWVTPTGRLVTDAEPETDEWFAARREGITGTDLPKILGLTKYGNALSVWLDKRGELDDDAGEAARWGQLLEETVAQEWAHRHAAHVVRVGVLAHTAKPWMRASLDRLVIPGSCPDGGDQCGLEVKTRSAFKAAEYRTGVPDDVLAQVEWGLLVTGLDHMHVAVLIGGQRLESLRVDRDELVERYLAEAAEPVWRAVLAGTPPEAHPDSEGVLLDLLNKLYAKREGERDLPDDARAWLDRYAVGVELAREAKKVQTEAKTALVQMLDDGDTGLLDGRVAFTYRRPAPGVTVTADALKALRAHQPDLYAALTDDGVITTTNPGPRFELKRTKEIS